MSAALPRHRCFVWVCGILAAFGWGSGLHWQEVDELRDDAVDYDLQAVADTAAASAAFPRSLEPPPLLILVDETLEADELQEVREAMAAAVGALPPATRVGLVTFGRAGERPARNMMPRSLLFCGYTCLALLGLRMNGEGEGEGCA